jgi:hypothetical protein
MKLRNFPGVPLSDNYSSHSHEQEKQLLAEHKIRLITFSPHTSHLFPPLDLVTFAAFEREKGEFILTDLRDLRFGRSPK